MAKRFQFSLQNLLMGMTLFCVCIWSLVSFRVAIEHGDVEALALLLLVLLASAGGAIGAILGRPLAGASLGVLIGLPLCSVNYVMIPMAFGFRF